VIARLRLALLEARPAVLLLLGLSGAVGLAVAGRAGDPVAVARLLVLVTAFVVYAVSLNDLADLEIDQVNLPDDDRRPLVTGTAAVHDVRLMAAGAAVVTASAAATQGLASLLLALGGLVVASAYSLPPVRLSRRGVVAPLVLPALFVGFPFVLGVLAGRGLRSADLVLLAALYVGFVGRIVLKDFRDVVGDRLFGKRTFLVRHGRPATCALSAVCWCAGCALLVVATPGATWWYAACQVVLTAVAVLLVARLARTTRHRDEERLVSSLAIIGRASVASLFVQVAAAAPGAAAYGVVGFTLLSLLLAAEMLRLGPRQARVTSTDPRRTSSAADSAATGSSSSDLRGLRESANDVTVSVLSRPDPSIRQ
jgi:4-hydroxybenzoate polyprenyltransferase